MHTSYDLSLTTEDGGKSQYDATGIRVARSMRAPLVSFRPESPVLVTGTRNSGRNEQLRIREERRDVKEFDDGGYEGGRSVVVGRGGGGGNGAFTPAVAGGSASCIASSVPSLHRRLWGGDAGTRLLARASAVAVPMRFTSDDKFESISISRLIVRCWASIFFSCLVRIPLGAVSTSLRTLPAIFEEMLSTVLELMLAIVSSRLLRCFWKSSFWDWRADSNSVILVWTAVETKSLVHLNRHFCGY
jgi:hypothetical protein